MLKDFTQEQFDVIIMGGQSNSVGHVGLGNVENPYEPTGSIWYLDEDFTIFMAREEGSGNCVHGDLNLVFAREYVNSGRLADGRKVLVVRASPGNAENMGGGFLNKCWGLGDKNYIRLIELTKTALSLNAGNRIVAFLWQCGETDAMKFSSYQTYYDNLKTLVDTYRQTFPDQHFHFLAAEMSHNWSDGNEAIARPVEEAARDVCRDVGGRFISSVGCTSNREDPESSIDDALHFSRGGLYELGMRYFKAYCELA